MTSKPATRSEQKAATRSHLLRIGRRQFAEHGYDATSIATVCRAARVTHGALYHHFSSKQALFLVVVAEIAVELATRVKAAADGREGWAQVEAASRAYLDACCEPDVQNIFLRDAPRVIPAEDFARLDHDANEPVVVGLLERWIQTGLWRKVPVESVARLLGATFAEAGALIASSERPQATRREVARILDDWICTFRADRRKSPG